MRAHVPVFGVACCIGLAGGSALAQDPTLLAPPESTHLPGEEAPAPPTTPARTHADKTRFLASVAASYAFQRLFDTSMNGGDVELVIGADFGKATFGGDFDVGAGETVYGLFTFTTTAGWLLGAHTGPFRFGGGTRFGYMHVIRATDGSGLGSVSIGAYGRASLDLVRLDPDGRGVVFLMVKASADYLGGDLYGFLSGVGVRF